LNEVTERLVRHLLGSMTILTVYTMLIKNIYKSNNRYFDISS